MPIKAVAVDIDGTLTDYDRLIDFAGVRALRRVEAKGIPVLVATGNVMPIAKAFTNFVGLSGPLVCENGGAVYANDLKRRKILFSRARCDAAVATLRAKGFKVEPIWSDPWRVSEVALSLDLDEAKVRAALNGSGLDVVATRFALHIMEPGLDKYEGIKAALEFFPRRVALKDILAVGDSNNDVKMLRSFAKSGCVANGSPSAKAAAKFVAKRKHGAGVAEVLRHYGLA